jgi:hypothetical protein
MTILCTTLVSQVLPPHEVCLHDTYMFLPAHICIVLWYFIHNSQTSLYFTPVSASNILVEIKVDLIFCRSPLPFPTVLCNISSLCSGSDHHHVLCRCGLQRSGTPGCSCTQDIYIYIYIKLLCLIFWSLLKCSVLPLVFISIFPLSQVFYLSLLVHSTGNTALTLSLLQWKLNYIMLHT